MITILLSKSIPTRSSTSPLTTPSGPELWGWFGSSGIDDSYLDHATLLIDELLGAPTPPIQ